MVTISRHVCELLLDRASLEPDRRYSRNGHPTRVISGDGCVINARRAKASYPVALFLFNDNCEKTLRTTGFRQLLAARQRRPRKRVAAQRLRSAAIKSIARACSASKVFSKSQSGLARDRLDMNLKTWGPDTSVTDSTRG